MANVHPVPSLRLVLRVWKEALVAASRQELMETCALVIAETEPLIRENRTSIQENATSSSMAIRQCSIAAALTTSVTACAFCLHIS